ncbi:hypothetical protein ACFVVM_30910 [Nocardia sp. NPDC058176]|uniref:hypothetical protein n=1 Tax=Nocardia sp. NPDC058176 TaxID=3346368 RepID=UPI0036DB744E
MTRALRPLLIACTVLAALFALSAFSATAGAQSPERIRFAPGTDGATVSGAVVRGTADTYVLEARAGQRITVAINSVEDNAAFDIYTPSGQWFPGYDRAVLPESGDYFIVVSPTRGNATYYLSVWIQ